MVQTDLKRRLAYSTVSQVAYIVLGVAVFGTLLTIGGIVHLVHQGLMKITLFFCAGAIYVASHKKNSSEMSGLGRVMPFTFGAFALASLGMIGAPPVGGFISKLYLLVGALDAGTMGILIVLVASTLLNTAYFAPVVYQAFFGKAPPANGHDNHGHAAVAHGEAPLAMVIPLCVTALASVALGFYPEFFMRFAHAVMP
jgi:multicomponent Na+:H+ antiporter subunit D